MEDLDRLIEDMEDRLEKIKVLNSPYTLIHYLHGRCHLFAQALHEELGYEIEFLWDDDYWFEGSDEPSTVLVHAYCVLQKGDCVDARGIVSRRMLERTFEYNSTFYQKVTLEELKEAMKQNELESGNSGEVVALRDYIRANIKNYKSGWINPEDGLDYFEKQRNDHDFIKEE